MTNPTTITTEDSLEKPILLNSRTQKDIPVFNLTESSTELPILTNNEE